MSNTTNIFQVLSDVESEGEQKPSHQESGKRGHGKRTTEVKTTQKNVQGGDNYPKETTQVGARTKGHHEGQREKGLTSEPHPMDRHSGTGISSYGYRKGGAGRGNVGTFKDDLRGRDTDKDFAEEEPAATQVVTEENKQMTLAD